MHSAYHPQAALLLLHGQAGCGKTALAIRVVTSAPFEYIKIIDAESLITLNEAQRIQRVTSIFHDAQKAESACIVFDSVERIVELIDTGAQVVLSHRLLHVLHTLIESKPRPGARVMVVATSSATASIMRKVLRLEDLFRVRLQV